MAGPDMSVTLLSRAEGESLYAWADALRDIRPALNDVGVVFQQATQDNVEARRDPWGAAWAAISDMTREVAARRGKTPGGSTFLPKIKMTIIGTNTVRIAIESKASRSFHFGIDNVRVFGRTTSKRVPARPILPLRGGRVDVPEPLMVRVKTALLDALRRALQSRRSG